MGMLTFNPILDSRLTKRLKAVRISINPEGVDVQKL